MCLIGDVHHEFGGVLATNERVCHVGDDHFARVQFHGQFAHEFRIAEGLQLALMLVICYQQTTNIEAIVGYAQECRLDFVLFQVVHVGG